MDESEHQPALHQHSKHIYGLSKQYLGYDPNNAGIRKLYKWFGLTIRGQFPGHRHLHPEQHRPYNRDAAVGEDDDDDNMSDIDPDLYGDSDDEFGDPGYNHDQHYDGHHDNRTEHDCCCGGNHGRWDRGLIDQRNGGYHDHNHWNGDGDNGHYGYHDGADYGDGGREHEHQHHGQGQWEDEY
ncbi:uncharacterized protein A1O5_06501 [Cladophialophora psammophila CBS 110553]|uniref:Uncharacterized protein n=1 Tax=Cladophialophora psammophila CBS 110553 TaxID=1182543 RepID=W9WR95_9EURO|nr:uncharacterized protein A1O5_06501 [Cladophialophora psammophila CBS 110553]EXJ70433.1 hypothetical protein A1O5_06501 [Cladophialophora psammophila CBS 110553]